MRSLRAACLAVLWATSASAEPVASVAIESFGSPQTSSTFVNGSFDIQNDSTAGERIVRVRYDFRTALLPDLVFDPFGTAGDVVAKPFQIDTDPGTGFQSFQYLTPHDGGFDELELVFDAFDPGELFEFSIDVDPTSIQGVGAPGPNDSGSVNGLELAITTITVEFDEGSTLVGQTFRLPGSDTGSAIELRSGLLAAPGIEVLGSTAPAVVFNASQTVRVSGPVGLDVSLLHVEAGLFVTGVPGGGFDLDAFEANSNVAVNEIPATIGAGGFVDIPVTLLDSDPESGLNHLVAVGIDGAGRSGDPSPVLVIELDTATPPPIGFVKSTLAGAGVTSPTGIQWGPDGRLYVAEVNGLIHVLTLTRNSPTDYAVTASEQITSVRDLPNHDDDGTLNPGVTTRQVTGILVVGTPATPVIYIGSSDPRIGAGGGGVDLGLDTNSGVISRLTFNGAGWDHLDLVVGLPRSEENHSVNGMQLDPVSNTLYAVVGGHTNKGGPSNNFAFTPEYALSAAILSIDLDAIGESTYFLPTLDDEDRAGPVDAGDPFGGNDGKNQAIVLPGGPVQIHAPGFRNAYDVLITELGRMYTVDNGPNAGWGAPPIGEGTPNCTNDLSEPGTTFGDGLHYVNGPGYYGGHPNPTRANPANTFNPSNPQSPVSVANPVECDFRAPGSDGALHVWGASTNGLAEYTATNFGGSMQGDLLTVSFDNAVQRVQLDAAGSQATAVSALFSSVGGLPLDVTTQGDSGAYPGTIWVADYGANGIVVFEPTDLVLCSGDDDPFLDEDGDGYDNADETDNGTSPCSPADTPPDWDDDKTSNLNDPDDDDDGLLDDVDPLAIDPANGTASSLPLVYSWDNNAPPAGGILNLGFTGLMTNGVDDYEALFDPLGMTAGGAAGVTTVDAVSEGDARDALDDQEFGLQFGIDAHPDRVGPFTASTSIVAPFNGVVTVGEESMGLQLGTGTQSDYAKLVVTAGGVEFGSEIGDVYVQHATAGVVHAGLDSVELQLRVDPLAASVEAFYRLTAGGMPGALLPLGSAQALPAGWFSASGLAVGLISTSRGVAVPFPVTWDYIQVVPETAACSDGLDNDEDGFIDLGDPGCSDVNDASERGPLYETFDAYTGGSDPEDWIDTSPNALSEDDSLFQTVKQGFTSYFATSSSLPNIHSHYGGVGSDGWADYEYTGRMRITDPNGGVGVTFLSQYPGTDAYYRLRRYADNAFHLSPHGTSMTGGVTDSGVVPLANIWYRFRIQVEDVGGRTEIRARVWQDGTAEPGVWQIDAYDDSPTRLTSGTVGIWSFNEGSKHWDDLEVGFLAPPPTNLVLTLSEVGNGTATPDPDQPQYAQGTPVTLTAVADPGWAFTGWSGDITTTDNPTQVVMNDDVDVTATFQLITQHTLTLLPVGPGMVQVAPVKALYDLGEVVTLTAQPDLGFVFTGWGNALAGNQNPENLTITGDLTVSANFGSQAAVLHEDFEAYGTGDDPTDWFDTDQNNSLVENDSLFQVFDLAGDSAFGTNSTAINIHSHYVGVGSDIWADYEFSGRMRIDHPNGGIGVTFLSQYPQADAYYRLRRFGSSDFFMASHGTAVTGGTTSTGVVPLADVWYRFRIQVEDVGGRTEIRARVWQDGTAEPGAWQIDAYDDSPTRLTFGTVGLWTHASGGKTLDDVEVSVLVPPAVACDDGIDNDGDGLTDLADTGCDDAADVSERSAAFQCDDGVDNDADGMIDFPADISCIAPDSLLETTTCSDAIDNDGDGNIDWDGGGVGPPDAQCGGDPTANREARSCGLGFEVALALPALLGLRRRRRSPAARPHPGASPH